MNLESNPSKKPVTMVTSDDIDFDFKPITSGLGFHSTKASEVKTAFAKELNHVSRMEQPARKDNQFYQNELSVFYKSDSMTSPETTEFKKPEKTVRLATTSHRIVAYILDLGFVLSCLGFVLTAMAYSIGMDLVELWSAYPNEITPLIIVLLCGFYLMYFSIFEKTSSSTLGKNLMGITVVNMNNKSQSLSVLLFRSFISLMNFISLGLFSYFDLQNKVSGSKVIQAK